MRIYRIYQFASQIASHVLTVTADGRALVDGVAEDREDVARWLFAIRCDPRYDVLRAW